MRITNRSGRLKGRRKVSEKIEKVRKGLDALANLLFYIGGLVILAELVVMFC